MGADGAHSSARKLVGGSFEGEEFDVSFSVTDAEITGGTPQNVVSYCYAPQGSLAFGPRGGGICRVAVSVPHSTDDTPPSREFFQRIVDERGPGHNVLGELRFSTTFRVHARIAAAFRTGRTLLTGDAAHIRSPARRPGPEHGPAGRSEPGLAPRRRRTGELPESVLDGYDLERRDAAHAVARTTALQTHWGSCASRARSRRATSPCARPRRPGWCSGPWRRWWPRPACATPRATSCAPCPTNACGRANGCRWRANRARRRAWPAGRGRRSPRTASPCCCGRAPAWRALARRVGDQVRQAFVVEPRYGEGPLADALGPKPVVAVVRPDGHLHAQPAPSQVDELDAALAAVR
ncbi:FAD-dependent monooxygenase [Amycolatopsis sp. NPDC049253]|uniref:FAD-dependent monooxygenase n=1 Tax=Amycolatopsis sp. NPDC049253 TaxID=3155274 RepID=UPI0034247C14